MLKMVFAFSRIGFVILVAGVMAWALWRFVRHRLYGDRASEIDRRERSIRGRERAAELEERELEIKAREAALERARSFLSERRQQLEDAEFEQLMRLLDNAHPGISEGGPTRSETIRERLRMRASGASSESGGTTTNPRVEREGA